MLAIQRRSVGIQVLLSLQLYSMCVLSPDHCFKLHLTPHLCRLHAWPQSSPNPAQILFSSHMQLRGRFLHPAVVQLLGSLLLSSTFLEHASIQQYTLARY